MLTRQGCESEVWY